MKLLNLIFAGAVITALILLGSCSGNSKKSGDDTSVIVDLKKDQVKKEVKEFVYPLPTAFEVTNMLNKIGAAYILTLSNEIEAVDKYNTEKQRALNLGIYNADLSYASTYNQKQNALNYMKVSNKLIEQLGFGEAINAEKIKEIEAVEDNKEKMIELITNTFYDTYEYLNKTNRESIALLTVTGSWIEGLYIATHISEDTYNNPEMVKLVMEQKEPLNKLMSILEEVKENEDIAATMADLKNIHDIFNTLDNGSISQAQMEAITAEIFKLRMAITN